MVFLLIRHYLNPTFHVSVRAWQHYNAVIKVGFLLFKGDSIMEYAKIEKSIWLDDKFPFLDDDQQLVFFHLTTTPFSNAIGIYRISIEALAAEKRWTVKRYTKSFLVLQEKEIVQYDKKFQVLYLLNFLKYNSPNSLQAITTWFDALQRVPECNSRKLFYENLKVLFTTKSNEMQKKFKETFKPFDFIENKVYDINHVIKQTSACNQQSTININNHVKEIYKEKKISEDKSAESEIKNNHCRVLTQNEITELLKGRKHIVEDNKIIERSLDASKTVKPLKKKYLDEVYLTDEEYNRLIAEWTEPVVKEFIERLDLYIGSNGFQKKYKDHNKTMRAWYKKDNHSQSKSSNQRKTFGQIQAENNKATFIEAMTDCMRRQETKEKSNIQTLLGYENKNTGDTK
jgi:hypothetical protein